MLGEKMMDAAAYKALQSVNHTFRKLSIFRGRFESTVSLTNDGFGWMERMKVAAQKKEVFNIDFTLKLFLFVLKPVSSMPDPFKPEQKRCILCKHNIEVDYKVSLSTAL